MRNVQLKAHNVELQKRLDYLHTYYQIMESIEEGYFEADLGGHITFCNHALLRISGYSREELIGKNFREFSLPRTARALQATFGRVYKTGQNADLSNYEVFHKNGHTLTVEFAAALIRDQQRQAAGFRGILRDVSEQIKAFEKQKRFQRP